MAYQAVSNTVPQYTKDNDELASGYYLKGYSAGTTTPLSMATDSTGGTTLAKCKLNASGYPISNEADETSVFVPYFNADYKLALYANSTDADNDTTASAIWVVDAFQVVDSSNITYNQGGTGAVDTTVQARLRQQPSLLDHMTDAQRSDVQGHTGSLDVTAACQSVLDAVEAAGGGRVIAPAGTYAVKALQIPTDVWVDGDGAQATIFTNSDSSDATSSNHLIKIDGDRGRLSNVQLKGGDGDTFGSIPYPYRLLYIEHSDGASFIEDVRVHNIECRGGRNAIWCETTSNLFADDITIRKSYEWGFALAHDDNGHKNWHLRKIRAFDVGINEGIKLASVQSGTWALDGNIEGCHCENCGDLDPTAANKQNGYDFFAGAGSRVKISHCVAFDNGSGAMEIKRNDQSSVTTNELKNIIIEGCIFDHTSDTATSLSFNMTTTTPAADTGHQVLVSNCIFNYSGSATPSSAEGVTITGWSDVTLDGCEFYGDWTKAINTSGAGVTGTTNARTLIRDCKVYGAQQGLSHSSDTLADCRLIDCDFECTDECVQIQSSTTSTGLQIKGGRFKSTNATDTSAINLAGNSTTVLIERAEIISADWGMRFEHASSTGEVRYCDITAGTGEEGIRIDDGTDWKIYENEFSVEDAQATVNVIGGTVVNLWAWRGWATAAPSPAGAVEGDAYRNSDPSNAEYPAWIYTSNGAWKGVGVIET